MSASFKLNTDRPLIQLFVKPGPQFIKGFHGDPDDNAAQFFMNYFPHPPYPCNPWSNFQSLLHFPFLIGARVALLGADQTTAAKIEKGVVHQLHALFLSGLNYSREHEGLCFADHVGDCRSVCKYFERQHAPLALGPRNELLTDDTAQRFADHDANLLLLTGRKDIE